MGLRCVLGYDKKDSCGINFGTSEKLDESSELKK